VHRKCKKSERTALCQCFPHGRTAFLRAWLRTARSLQLRARIFSVITGWLRGSARSYSASPTRTVWRFHVPRIWIRSINLCTVAVKRKSQNLANFLPTRPYLVVLFRESLHHYPSQLTLNSLHPIPYDAFAFLHGVHNFPHSSSTRCRAASRNSSRFEKNPPVAEKIQRNGTNNAGKINFHFYRGAQPKLSGRQSLQKLGVTTIIGLRGEHRSESENEKNRQKA
jgi:hypothetical protein